MVVNRPFKSLRSEREKGGLQEKEKLTCLHWKFTNNVLLIPFPSSMYELPYLFFLCVLMDFVVVFVLKIREVSRLPHFNNHPLIYLRHLPKETHMYSSLYEFLSLKFITQSPFNHRASFVFMITACMMSGTGVHWCQTKIKFGFKSLEVLQKHEVSDCATQRTVEKPDLPLCFSKNMFILFKA